MPDPPRDESPSGAAPQTQEHTPTGFHKVVTDLSRAAWLRLDNLFGDGFSVFVPDVQCWTPEAGRRLRAAAAGNREEDAGTFLEKLQDRLTGSDNADPPCSGADPASRPAELQSQTVDEASPDHRSPLLAPQPSGNDPVGVDRDLDAIHRKLYPQRPDRYIDWYTEPWYSQWKPSPHVDSCAWGCPCAQRGTLAGEQLARPRLRLPPHGPTRGHPLRSTPRVRAPCAHNCSMRSTPCSFTSVLFMLAHQPWKSATASTRRTSPRTGSCAPRRTEWRRCRQMQGAPAHVRSRLRRLAARLTGARLLVAGQPRPSWRASRLNRRYASALHVAELVLDHLGLSIEQGSQPVASFVTNMADTFERFVTTAVSEACAQQADPAGGRTCAQFQTVLDTDTRCLPTALCSALTVTPWATRPRTRRHSPSAMTSQHATFGSRRGRWESLRLRATCGQ